MAASSISMDDPWDVMVDDLGLEEYYPEKLTLQKVRSLRPKIEALRSKKDLPWKVLDQIMLINCHPFSEPNIYTAPKTKTFGKKGSQQAKIDSEIYPPHPTDLMLLLFTCSDFMLRQVLAKKMFMCRLAIPFIIPMQKDECSQMLVWPLRSIVMEWRNDKNNVVCAYLALNSTTGRL